MRAHVRILMCTACAWRVCTQLAHAEKLLLGLLRHGVHRASALPALCRLPHLTGHDALCLAAGFVRLCAKQLGLSSSGGGGGGGGGGAGGADGAGAGGSEGADGGGAAWPVVGLATAWRQRGGYVAPPQLQAAKVRERVGGRARDDLSRLHALLAVHALVDDTCAALATSGGRGGGGAAAAEAAAVSSAGSAADGIADERWARAMLAPGDAPPTLAAWSGSLLGRAALGLRGLLSEVKGAPPHPSWTADHGARQSQRHSLMECGVHADEGHPSWTADHGAPITAAIH